jgi:hypothetical protein
MTLFDQATRLARGAALPLCLAVFFLQPAGAAHAGEAWPQLALPDDLRTFPVGDELVVGGAALQLRGFASDTGPAELAGRLRKALGAPLVETTNAHGLVLGRALGAHYVTIQFTPAARGSRGWIALTPLRSSYGEQQARRAEAEQMLARFPSGSKIVSHIQSNDGGRRARHLLVTNESSEQFNADRIKTMMQGDGMHLEREIVADARRGDDTSGRFLLFAGADRQATARVYQDESGRTLVVLNTSTMPEASK